MHPIKKYSFLSVKKKLKNIRLKVLYINNSNTLTIIEIEIYFNLNFFIFIKIYSPSNIIINPKIETNLIIDFILLKLIVKNETIFKLVLSFDKLFNIKFLENVSNYCNIFNNNSININKK